MDSKFKDRILFVSNVNMDIEEAYHRYKTSFHSQYLTRKGWFIYDYVNNHLTQCKKYLETWLGLLQDDILLEDYRLPNIESIFTYARFIAEAYQPKVVELLDIYELQVDYD